MKRDILSYVKILIIGAIFFSVPTLQEMGILEYATVTVIGTVLYYSVAAIGLNVLLGYSGLVSLGTAGFMGLGAYLSGYFVEDNFVLGIVVAIAIPAILGLIVGLISLRLEGYYLAIATLGIAEILKTMFTEFDKYTGGFSGMNIGYPEFFNSFGTNPRNVAYWIAVILLVVLLIITHNFIHSSTGRAMLAMKGSSAAAQAMGVNLLKYKLTAFIIATMYAALAGILYMFIIRSSYPNTWGLNLSLQLLAVVVIGGVRTITGPIFGSIIVFGIPELVFKQIPVISEINGISFIFTGILIIIIILFYPNGLLYLGTDIKRLIKRGKSNG